MLSYFHDYKVRHENVLRETECARLRLQLRKVEMRRCTLVWKLKRDDKLFEIEEKRLKDVDEERRAIFVRRNLSYVHSAGVSEWDNIRPCDAFLFSFGENYDTFSNAVDADYVR